MSGNAHPIDLPRWHALVASADIGQCEILHGLIVDSIHAQLERRDHPTLRYKQLRVLENVLVERVNSLGGYPA